MPPKTSTDANKPVHDRSSSNAGRVTTVEVHNPPQQGVVRKRGKAEQTPGRKLALEGESSQSKKTKLPTTLAESHAKISTQSKLLESKDEEIKKLKEEKKKLRKTKLALSDKLKAKKESYQDLHNNLQKLQTERLENAISHELPPIPDEEVKTELSKICLNIKAFSNRWAARTWTQIDEERHSEIMAKLETASVQPLCSQRMKHAIKEKRIAPKIILNAIINALLCNETFSRPFAYLRRPGSNLEAGVVEGSLEWLTDTATAESHGWNHIVKAKILRVIDMPFAVEQWVHNGTRCSPAIKRLRDKHIALACFTIIQQCRPFLRKLENPAEFKRNTEFMDIVKECQTMASALAVQFSCVKMFFWKELHDQCFAMDHKDLEPHRGMKLKDGDHDEEGQDPKKSGIEGSLIDMVVEPLVIRLGDTNGTHHDIIQNIRKAVVWVLASDNLGDTGKISGSIPRPPTKQDIGQTTTQISLQSEKEPLHDAQTPNGKRVQIQSHCPEPQKQPVGQVPAKETAVEYQFIEPSKISHESSDSILKQALHQQNNSSAAQPHHDNGDFKTIKKEKPDDVISVSSEEEDPGVSSKSRRAGTGQDQDSASNAQQKHERNRQQRGEKRAAPPAESQQLTDEMKQMEPVSKRTRKGLKPHINTAKPAQRPECAAMSNYELAKVKQTCPPPRKLRAL